MKQIFKIEKSIMVPDGTVVYPFLNPKDCTSNLPWDLIDDFSITLGKIEAGIKSKIHVLPLVTQVTFILRGNIEGRMKDLTQREPFTLSLYPDQAVITRPGTFLQFINETNEICYVLYIVSPAYLFECDACGNIIYDDSIVLEEDWAELRKLGWKLPENLRNLVNVETRKDAAKRLENQKGRMSNSTRRL